MKYIFHLAFPPRFELERELGKGYLALGIVRTAYDIFERLEMWKPAIECLQISGVRYDKNYCSQFATNTICVTDPQDHDKAIELVEERIKVEGETAELLCLKGDALRDKEKKREAYLKSWNVSNKKYPQPKRQLGLMAMEEQKVSYK